MYLVKSIFFAWIMYIRIDCWRYRRVEVVASTSVHIGMLLKLFKITSTWAHELDLSLIHI